MGTVQNIQSSFSEGRISPRLHGQIDIPSYKTSLKTLENFIVLPQGSVARRPGTYYVSEASTTTAYQSKLVPFYYGQGQSYVLEFYADNIKIFYNNGILGLQSNNATQFTIASTGYTATEIADIKYIQSADVIFLAHPNHPPKKIERTVPTSSETGYGSRAEDGSYWAISNIDFVDGPYDELNKVDSSLFKIEKPNTGSNQNLDFVEIGGVGVDTALDAFVNSSHGLQAGMKIYFHKDGITSGGVGNLVTDDAGTAFAYFTSSDNATATSQGNSTTYYVVNPTATTFQITDEISADGVLGTPITFKLSGTNTKWTGKINVVKMILKKDRTDVRLIASGTGNTPFTHDGGGVATSGVDIGVIYRVNVLAGIDRDKIKGIRWTSIKITAIVSTTEARGTLQEDCVLNNATTLEWNAGVFNSTNGYPSDVSLYQQRLVFAGTKKYSATVWFSKTGDFFNFASSELLGSSTGNIDPTGAVILGEQILDDNALTFTIDSDTVDKISWLSEGTKLAVGTTGGVFTIYGSENDLTLTPFNFTVVKESAYPAGSADALQIGEKMLYVQQNERKIREMKTAGEQQAEYGAMDLTLRSEDITYSGVKEMTYQEQPFSVVWGRLGNGKLIALTHESSLNMYAWSTHTIGGTHTDATHGNHAKVESIITIPEDNRSQTWMIVKRTIGGSTKRQIEYMTRFHDAQEIAQVDAHFVDSGLKTYNSSAFTTASGYGHLEGQTLSVLGDGAIQPDQVVASGNIGSTTALISSNTVVAGLGYTSELVTLPMTMGDGGGSFVIGNKRMIKINMKMLNSLGLEFSMEGQDYEEVIFRNPSQDQYGNMVPLFTGNKEMAPIARSFESEGVSFRCTQPFPFTILYIAQQFEVNLG
tara:strand:+ start:668 stop:3289 length:2622 start_codon:yes stop_codon:yes gene_type:complete